MPEAPPCLQLTLLHRSPSLIFSNIDGISSLNTFQTPTQ